MIKFTIFFNKIFLVFFFCLGFMVVWKDVICDWSKIEWLKLKLQLTLTLVSCKILMWEYKFSKIWICWIVNYNMTDLIWSGDNLKWQNCCLFCRCGIIFQYSLLRWSWESSQPLQVNSWWVLVGGCHYDNCWLWRYDVRIP